MGTKFAEEKALRKALHLYGVPLIWFVNQARHIPARRVFEGETFEFLDNKSARLFEDVEFRRCRFQGCTISVTLDPRRRTTVRNIRIIDWQLA